MTRNAASAVLAIAGLVLAAPARAVQAPSARTAGSPSTGIGCGKLVAYVSSANRGATHACPRREWVPGHFETRCERVWVPGEARRVWVPAAFETRFDLCGRPIRVCVRAGYWASVVEPGRYETVETRAWVAGHWRRAG
jgi:hypothetical protein